MQPYFFPYIGYFQLINCVQKFVIYDDVNFIKKGWINRNKILNYTDNKYINLPIKNISQNKKICDLQIINDESWKKKFIKNIIHTYKKAPNYSNIYGLIESIINKENNSLSEFLYAEIDLICKYLNINTEIIKSSNIYQNTNLSGINRIIDICQKEGASVYINPIGGVNIYDYENFNKCHIDLFFLKTKNIKYKQFKNPFIASLSIIDVLMFNTKDEIIDFLGEYELIKNHVL